jgi:hypothetical protein
MKILMTCTQLMLSPVSGVNLDGLADWGPELSFLDIMKRSRDWVPHEFTSYTWNTNVPIDIGPTGYPVSLKANQRVGTMMMRDLQSHGISGVYTVLYDGDGVITPSMTDIKGVRRMHGGRLEVQVEVMAGVHFL